MARGLNGETVYQAKERQDNAGRSFHAGPVSSSYEPEGSQPVKGEDEHPGEEGR